MADEVSTWDMMSRLIQYYLLYSCLSEPASAHPTPVEPGPAPVSVQRNVKSRDGNTEKKTSDLQDILTDGK